MSSEHAERLSAVLNHLPFAESVMTDNTADGTKVQVICRVKKGAEQHWAKVVEKILRKSEDSGFHAHVCRLYFMRDDAMIYGWHVGVTSTTMGYAIEQIIEAVMGPRKAVVKTPTTEKAATAASMRGYNPPLDADSKGNPVVKRQIMEMPFTGMEGRADRNMPSAPNEDGRGGGRGVTKIS